MFVNAILQRATKMGVCHTTNIPQRSTSQHLYSGNLGLNMHTAGAYGGWDWTHGLYHYHSAIAHLLFDINFVTCGDKLNPTKLGVDEAWAWKCPSVVQTTFLVLQGELLGWNSELLNHPLFSLEKKEKVEYLGPPKIFCVQTPGECWFVSQWRTDLAQRLGWPRRVSK